MPARLALLAVALVMAFVAVACGGRAPDTPPPAPIPTPPPGPFAPPAGPAPSAPDPETRTSAPAAPAPPVRTAPDPLPPAMPEDLSPWTRLGPPAPGTWRVRFPSDVPLDFDEYVASRPVRADDGRNVLAFLPVGDFAPDERAALDAAAEFSGIWFGLPVRVLDPVPLTENPGWSRLRDAPSGRGKIRQFRTGWFLDSLLPDRRPEDAVVLLGVTMADLYPEASWNYVFGQAHLRRRVGVYSLARYFPGFWGEEATPEAGRRALLRTLKVVTHEAGHTFGLEHCVTWACNMNGSNSLDETDAQPLLLCPDCLRKLAWNRGFDVAARDRRLAEFLARHGLAPEAEWHRRRAESR